jgi:hypothetical protein
MADIEVDRMAIHVLKSRRHRQRLFFPIHMHDGFLHDYCRIVRSFIRQAEAHFPDFRVSLCLCAPDSPASETEMRAQWAEHIRWLFAESADSKIWLRTPDGRLLFYTWVRLRLADCLRRAPPLMLSALCRLRKWTNTNGAEKFEGAVSRAPRVCWPR